MSPSIVPVSLLNQHLRLRIISSSRKGFIAQQQGQGISRVKYSPKRNAPVFPNVCGIVRRQDGLETQPSQAKCLHSSATDTASCAETMSRYSSGFSRIASQHEQPPPSAGLSYDKLDRYPLASIGTVLPASTSAVLRPKWNDRGSFWPCEPPSTVNALTMPPPSVRLTSALSKSIGSPKLCPWTKDWQSAAVCNPPEGPAIVDELHDDARAQVAEGLQFARLARDAFSLF